MCVLTVRQAYVVDTGILITHNDFGGRAEWGANFVDSNDVDCNGHGTHVAGTVGGTVYGVAKESTLVAVKVLNCAGSGTNAGVIDGYSNNFRSSQVEFLSVLNLFSLTTKNEKLLLWPICLSEEVSLLL
jgi:hypothetical protein